MSDPISLEERRRRLAEKQREVEEKLIEPASLQAAEDIALVCLTEDMREVLGVGLYPPPENGKAWLLTPEQADALALTLVRCAAKARRMRVIGTESELEYERRSREPEPAS